MLRRAVQAVAAQAKGASGGQQGLAGLLIGGGAAPRPLSAAALLSCRHQLLPAAAGAAAAPVQRGAGAARGYAQLAKMPRSGYTPPAETQKAMQMRLSMVSCNVLAEPYRGPHPRLPLTAYVTLGGWKELWRRFLHHFKTFYAFNKTVIPGFKRGADFKADSVGLYRDVCRMLAEGDKRGLRQLVTPAIYTDLKRQLKQREDGGWDRVSWQLVREPEAQEVSMVHGRLIMLDPKNDDTGFVQITLCIPSAQRFAAYDRQGRLVAGSPDQVVEVVDHWVFERSLKPSPSTRWRLAGRLSIASQSAAAASLPLTAADTPAAGEPRQQQQRQQQQAAAEPPPPRVGHVADQQRVAAHEQWGRKPARKVPAARGRR